MTRSIRWKLLAIAALSLLIFINVSKVWAYSFDEKGRRTSISIDIFRRLHEHFPYAQNVRNDCTILTKNNSGFLGENLPDQGKPIFNEVSPAFLNWYYGCILSYWGKTNDSPTFLKTDGSMYLGDTARDYFARMRLDVDYAEFKDLPVWEFMTHAKWTVIPVEIQTGIILNLIHSFIGDGILGDENILVQNILKTQAADATLNARAAVREAIVVVMTQEEFLDF